MPVIDAIEVRRLHVPLRQPWTTAYGSDAVVEPVLVRMHAGEHQGWGEAQAFQFPTYCPEHARGIYLTVSQLMAPQLIGKDIDSGERLHEILVHLKGNPFSKGVLDMAWWDLEAKRQGKPLWQQLGGVGPVIQTGADFGIQDSIDTLLALVGEAVAAGAPRIKLKFSRAWGVEVVATVRDAFPTQVFHIDCNSGFTLDDLDMFRRIDDFNLAMIEQPLTHDDLIDHATLQRQIATPVCLDESATSPGKVRKAIEIGACRYVNIKPIRVGGLTPSLAIHRLCVDAGIGWWIGGMVETGIGVSHEIAFSTMSNPGYPQDIFPSSYMLKRELVAPALTYSGSYEMTAPDRPGIGREIDMDFLDHCTVDKTILGAPA